VISFTKKAAAKLKINTSGAVPCNSGLSEEDDWVIDTVWDVKRDPWIMFYHRSTTFAVIVQPDKYKIENCIYSVLTLITELLDEYNLLDKMSYFVTLFSNLNVCHNDDRSSVAYMTQNKFSAHCGLENPHVAYRVNDLYSLMIHVNDIIRGKFDLKKTSLDAFIEMVRRIPVETHTIH
jgi:hypothetical protein